MYTEKSINLLIIAILLLPSFTPHRCVTTTDQGLYWGIEVGDRFDFYFTRETFWNEYETTTYDYYIIADSLPLLPDSIGGRPLVTWRYYSSIEDYHERSIASDRLVFPIGNWTTWTDLFSQASGPYTISDTIWTWSLSYSLNDTWARGTRTDEHYIYSKFDGVLIFESYAVVNQTTNSLIVRDQYTRTSYIAPEFLIFISAISIGVISLIIVTYRRRSRRQ